MPPLGHAFADTGIIAAFLASILGSLVPALVRGSGPMFGGPRPAQTLIFAALLGTVIQADAGDAFHIVLVGILCVTLAGLLQVAFGLLGLGRIIRFTPLPVLAGFTNGVALSMMLSASMIIFSNHAGASPLDLELADMSARLALVAVILLLMSRLYRLLPAVHWSLLGLIAGTLFHLLLTRLIPDLSLGEMLPAVTSLHPGSGIGAMTSSALASFDWQGSLLLVLPPALSLATLNSLESLVIATHQDVADGTRHDSKRVLVGQGLANAACGLLGALPTAPSNSRQLVSKQMGGDTWAASIVFALAMFAILLLTPLFVGWIPKLVVAALLLFMAFSIIDPWSRNQLRSLWRQDGGADFQTQLRSNLWVMLAVMAVAVSINLVAAMAVGVILSMVLFVQHNSRSIVSRVYPGNKRQSAVMRPVVQMECLDSHGHGIVLVELAGPLFFGSGELLMDEVEILAKDVNHVILDFRQVGTIDVSGAGAIQRIARRLQQSQVRLSLSSISPEETRGRMITGANARNALPSECWFEDSDLALEAAEDTLLAGLGLADTGLVGQTLDLDSLRGFDAEQFAVLEEHAEVHHYSQGEVLFRRGDPGDTLFLLLSGQVEIRVPMQQGGRNKRLISLRPGTIFGEMAVLRGAPRSADAIAVTDKTLVMSLHQLALHRLHQNRPDIAQMLMRNIGSQLAARLALTTNELRYALN
jgi:SulP family sulfate permease